MADKEPIVYDEDDQVLLLTGEYATIVNVIDDTHYFVTVTADDGWSTFREVCIDDIQCRM